jgi:hypothetical protein
MMDVFLEGDVVNCRSHLLGNGDIMVFIYYVDNDLVISDNRGYPILASQNIVKLLSR